MVLDASVLVDFLIETDRGQEVERRLGESTGWLWAPAVIDAEVGHALRAEVRRRSISPRLASEALADLMDMQLERVSHRFIAERAWQLRDNLSFYDGLYVALAEALDAPLLTSDARLARAPGILADVEVLSV
ncbi:MAG TPA: type II toxin-antitoxin system VapC family toxin [Solirubrobacterales bacterium]|jgi:predicted nucleic acid-binding protein|nr:type II toxin-antitoxin system VapC family toxin [Solirubrobacterales bacterium]